MLLCKFSNSRVKSKEGDTDRCEVNSLNVSKSITLQMKKQLYSNLQVVLFTGWIKSKCLSELRYF